MKQLTDCQTIAEVFEWLDYKCGDVANHREDAHWNTGWGKEALHQAALIGVRLALEEAKAEQPCTYVPATDVHDRAFNRGVFVYAKAIAALDAAAIVKKGM